RRHPAGELEVELLNSPARRQCSQVGLGVDNVKRQSVLEVMGGSGGIETVTHLSGQRAGEIAVERDGDVLVVADAILDGFGILLAMNQRFPGIDVLGFMEVAVGDERQS